MSYRERRYLADKARRQFLFREFTPENLALDLPSEYDAMVRRAPSWEMEFILYLRQTYHSFELTGDAVPPWIGLSLQGEEGEIRLAIKTIVSHVGLHFVCGYPKGGTTALKQRSPLTVADGSVRKIDCRIRRWIRQ